MIPQAVPSSEAKAVRASANPHAAPMIEVIRSATDPALGGAAAYLKSRASGAAVGEVCPEHDPRWLAVLRQGLKHKLYCLVSRDGGSDLVNGYLPLALVTSRLFGRFLVSLPYLNRAGVVADSESIAASLIDKAVALAGEHDVDYLELRHSTVTEHADLGASRGEKVRMVLDLPDTRDDMLAALKSKVRSQIKKSGQSNFTIRWGRWDLLNAFYDVFAVNMRDLGTPVYAKRLFARVIEQLGDDAEFCAVSYQGKVVAAAMLIHDQHYAAVPMTSVPSASSLREYNPTGANMWMYFELLARAIERGSKRFDFGRSSEDSSTYKFKKQWGSEPEPTVWQYHVRRGDMNAARPDSPKMKRRIEMWQKLPVWFTRVAGPPIVRGIP